MSSLRTKGNFDVVPPLCCYQLDPTRDPRWDALLKKHPNASVFHSTAWLEALRRTYGYEPVVFTTSPPGGELTNGIVFCRVDSWLTGRRLVSLPFSDHCQPLFHSGDELSGLVRHLSVFLHDQRRKYFEIRTIENDLSGTDCWSGCRQDANYFLHTLDLRRDLNEVFRGFSKDSVQRRIRRAERAGLVERCGTSEDLLKEFYALFVMTRRRHRVPPSPYCWFKNLVLCCGKTLEIRLAYKNEIPLSAILTLRFKDAVYYKYGCSDQRLKSFGATPWLLWKAVTAAKSAGANQFDMGRTQVDNLGLLSFKGHWVPQPTRLIYWRFPPISSLVSGNAWKARIAKRTFSCMPLGLLKLVGRGIYRHIG
jgi:lipid II:glycine glycyltransferase (peptidoglycan interpeptide bridge formation enzyme)